MILEDFKKYKVNVEGFFFFFLDSYIKDIKDLLDYLKIEYNDINSIINIKSIDIEKYLIYLAEEKNNSVSSRNKKISAIKSFFYFLDREDYKIDRKIQFIKRAKVRHREAFYLTDSEINVLLYTIDNIRDKAMITFFLTTGARLSDMEQIKVDDIYTPKEKRNGKYIYYSIVRGKGDKERKIYLSNSNYDTLEYLRTYEKTERKKIIDKIGNKTDILFITNNGNKIDHDNIRKMVKRWARKAGIKEWDKVSPHTFRHSFATHAFEANIPPEIIRDAMGHANISTTNTYCHSKDWQVQDLMEGINYGKDNKLWGKED